MRKVNKTILLIVFLFQSNLVYSQINPQLYDAIVQNDLEAVKEAIAAGADVNGKNEDGGTAIMLAVYKSDLEIVKYLVAKGADIHVKGLLKREPRGYYGNLTSIAADKEKIDHLKYLIEELGIPATDKGYDPSTGKKDSWGAMKWAVNLRRMTAAAYLYSVEPDNIYFNNMMGLLYHKMGAQYKALGYFNKSIEISKTRFGENSLEYADALYDKVGFYIFTGQYAKALKVNNRILEIAESIEGKWSKIYASYLNNQGIIQRNIGEYPQALDSYVESLNILDSLNLAGEYGTGFFYNNIGRLYKEIGDLDQSLIYYKKALKIKKKFYDKKPSDYGRTLNNIAKLYQKRGELEEAEQAFLESLKVYEETIGINTRSYALTQKNIADLYVSQNKLDTAISLFIPALHVLGETMGREQADYATALISIARFYKNKNELEKALVYYDSIYTIKKHALGEKHKEMALASLPLSKLYENKGDIDSSKALLKAGVKSASNWITQHFEHLSEQEQRNILANNLLFFNYLRSFGYRNKQLLVEIFEAELLLKNLLLSNKKELLAQLDKMDESFQGDYKKWQDIKSLLAYETTRSLKKRGKHIDSLQIVANNLESQLARRSNKFKEQHRKIRLEDLKRKLKSQDAIIEFISFEYEEPLHKTDSILYIALILKPNIEKPIAIPLFEEKELATLLAAKGARRNDYVSDLYNIASRGLTPRTKGKRSLHQLIWQPLDSILTDVNTIYFAPSGLLHRVNLAAIQVNKRELLANKFELIQLSSSRQLAIEKEEKFTNKEAVLFGGISFDLDTIALSEEVAKLQTISPKVSFNVQGLDRNLRGDGWHSLSYTEEEVIDIGKLLNENGFNAQVFTKKRATEEIFKKIGRNNASPNILHIATHGYFFPDKQITNKEGRDYKTAFELSNNPMLRSGLVLSGGNYVWKGNVPIEGKEDGVLTAYEISQMNLRNTELVVLSACETGLGDINNSEGVYGLQRAFKLAGAKYIIMSLWQVPDRQTSMLMKRFYKKWLVEKLPIKRAFSTAQQEMQAIGMDSFYWAGFVLVE
jgi:CHAT domain-containing protein